MVALYFFINAGGGARATSPQMGKISQGTSFDSHCTRSLFQRTQLARYHTAWPSKMPNLSTDGTAVFNPFHERFSILFTAPLLFTIYFVYRITHQLILWPRYLSPLRKLPGPALGTVLTGQFHAILEAEAGIIQRDWVKTYGPVVRAVGPVGIERLIFCRPEAIHKILVSNWVEYPRVRTQFIWGRIFTHVQVAWLPTSCIGLRSGLRTSNCHRKRAQANAKGYEPSVFHSASYCSCVCSYPCFDLSWNLLRNHDVLWAYQNVRLSIIFTLISFNISTASWIS